MTMGKRSLVLFVLGGSVYLFLENVDQSTSELNAGDGPGATHLLTSHFRRKPLCPLSMDDALHVEKDKFLKSL